MKREELIAYDNWLTSNKWGSSVIITPEQAADLYLAEHPLSPAEGAEQVQRCPVCMGRGLVPNNFYATTSGIGSTTQTYLPEKCRTCNGAGVIIPPYPKLQPDAEGAEEMLKAVFNEIWDAPVPDDVFENPDYRMSFADAKIVAEKFATLHAQRLAEKMVEEKLREELIAYGKVVRSWGIAIPSDILECSIDEYLKSREK